jgi:16S rRNA (uracil1498-N3)-methyltransferase
MNRILFEQQAAAYTMDPRFEHVRGVLRMREGDCFDAGVVNGPVGRARITRLDASALEVEVEWGQRPPLPPPIHLLVGLCRPATVRKVLAAATTMGVRDLAFAPASRSDPAYARSRLWTGGEWRRHLLEGAAQAFDTYVPPVLLHPDLPAAVAALPPDSLRLALDVYEGGRRLSRVDVPPGRPVCLAVGPERGWDSSDRSRLRDGGFELVALGERVLRLETAVTVGLTLLSARLGLL